MTIPPSNQRLLAGTTVTESDLMMIGAYLLNWCAASHVLGHAQPQSSTMYITPPDDRCAQLVADVMRAAGESGPGMSEPWQRVHDFLWQSGWMQRQMDLVAETTFPEPLDNPADY